jgi:biotin carboxyl carrier protein
MTTRRVRIDGATHEVALAVDAAGAFTLREGERTITGMRRWVGARLEITVSGHALAAHVVRGPRGGVELWMGGERYAVEELRAGAGATAGGGAAGGAAGDDELLAPMPAKIVRVHVAAGDAVTDGQALVVLESMKMELSVTAPRAGRVRRVGADVIPGAIVTAGTLLVELEPASAPSPAG